MEQKDPVLDEEQEIKVSVCCLAYNHAKYIERTLQGFVKQITDFRFEVIVHDDASTDNTKKIIQKYVDLYPHLFVPIYEAENQYSKAKDILFPIIHSRMRGKYIAYCEGDDYWVDENKLQKQYDVLEANPECSICVHRTQFIKEDGSPMVNSDGSFKMQEDGYKLQPGVIEKDRMATMLWLRGGYPFHTSSYFIRKSAIEDRISGKAEFAKYIAWDLAFLRLGLSHGKFFFLDDVMSHRRINVPGSWNTRWAASNTPFRLRYTKNRLKSEMMFDEYSNHQFHDYINIICFNLATECFIYDTGNGKKYQKYVKRHPLSFKMVHDADSLLQYIRYHIMRLSPQLYYLLHRIQVILIKKEN